MIAELPENESERLEALRRYKILDTPRESDFDDVVRLAAAICGTPISLVSLVDQDRQWFKGHYGLDIQQTPRRLSFCAHAILEAPNMTIVPDATKDKRFADNELVTGETGIRFYAGAPLVNSDGHALGTLCVIDRQPRQLTPLQRETLQVLSRQVVAQLELRRRVRELGRASQELQEANDELRAFGHAISHDLRAPLRASVNFAEILLLSRGEQLDARGRGLLEQIIHSGQRTSAMLEDFLRLLHVKSQPLHCADTDMQPLVESILAELKAQDPSDHPAFVIKPLPHAVADPGLIRQVWTNLLSNAVKFSRVNPHPTVQVSGSHDPDRIVYKVQDNGPGFDPAGKDKLWKPFNRLHGPEVPGTGLGLSIVKRIVEHHGGQVWAESEPGSWAAFYFTLPNQN